MSRLQEQDEEALVRRTGADVGRLDDAAYTDPAIAVDRVKQRSRRHRVGVRTLILLTVVVVVFTVSSLFTDNRFVDGVPVAAAAAATPIALLLGVRRVTDVSR